MHTYTFIACLDTGMQNNDESLSIISPAGRGQLIKMWPMKLLNHMVYFDQI